MGTIADKIVLAIASRENIRSKFKLSSSLPFADYASNINKQVTAEAADILSGKVIIDSNGDTVTGTIETVAARLDTDNNVIIVPAGFIAVEQTFPVAGGSSDTTTDNPPTPADVREGKEFFANGSKFIGTMGEPTLEFSDYKTDSDIKYVVTVLSGGYLEEGADYVAASIPLSTTEVDTTNQFIQSTTISAGYLANDITYTSIDVDDIDVNLTSDSMLSECTGIGVDADGNLAVITGSIDTMWNDEHIHIDSYDGGIDIPGGYYTGDGLWIPLNPPELAHEGNQIICVTGGFVTTDSVVYELTMDASDISINKSNEGVVITVTPGNVSDEFTETIPAATISTDSEGITTISAGYIHEPIEISTTSGEGSGETVQYGYVDDSGRFQELSLSGDVPTNSGDPVDLTNLCMYETGVAEPEYGSGGGSADYYKCASVDKLLSTWSGNKAEFVDGVFVFNPEITDDLTYGSGFTPVVGKIYNSDAVIEVSKVWSGSSFPVDGLILYDELTDIEATTTATGDPMAFNNCATVVINGKQAIKFDGDSSVIIDVPDNKLPTGSSARTISLWGLANDYNSTWMAFVSYGEDVENSLCVVRSNEGKVGAGFSWNDYDSETEIVGEWHHIAMTYSPVNNNVSIYVDGVLALSREVEGQIDTAYSAVKVGVGVDQGTNLRGYVKCLRIYNRVLSQDEIAELAYEHAI